MKASSKIVITSIAIVGAIVLCFFATSSWRESHGLTFSSFGARGPQTIQEELDEFDAKLKPVAERRAKLREQLDKLQAKERDVFADVADRLGAIKPEKRAELRAQFESGKLSDDNLKRPEITVLFAKYQEALVLRKHSAALSEHLAKYEYELTRALAERDRLQERADTIDALGFDPEKADDQTRAESYDALDELAAKLDSTQNGLEDAALTVEDVVEDGSQASQVAEELFSAVPGETHDWNHEETNDAQEDLSDQLTIRLQDLEENRTIERRYSINGLFSKGGAIVVMLFGGLFLIGTILVLGVIGIFAATKEASVVQVQPGQAPAPGQPPVVVVNQKQGLSEGRIVAIVVATALGTCFGGPVGGVLGLIFGLLCSSWRSAIRALGVLGFVLISIFLTIALLMIGFFAIVA